MTDEIKTATEAPCVVCKVTVRTPPFWPEEPALWFSQMEAQFAIAGISSDTTKFNHVIGQLEHKYAVEVKDIISNPPADNKYEKIKSQLISRISVSKEQKFLQLMKNEELGDRKPSRFLRHLRALAGEGIPEDFLKTVWISRLPGNLQALITSQAKATLEELAESADKVYDVAPQTLQVHALGTTTHGTEISEIARQMTELTREVAALKAGNPPHTSRSSFRGSRAPFRSSNRQDRSASRPRDQSICFYHNRFGDRATRCTRPCSYPGAENFSGSRN
ncbi:uncharacterized protein LOC134803082 [Cydia splendana]|uniref:uncharacterized protein LOC134803082 n=1 Tax=Cydia splendana TaxID=1100963 RepID=UPI00300DAD9A